MEKIKIQNLDIIFGRDKHRALKMLKEGESKTDILKASGCTVAVQNANLNIREGEFFVVMGLSGSGKSTLLRAINKLNNPTNGQVLVNGTDVLQASEKDLLNIRRKVLAMVFQHFGLLPHRTVVENIAFGLELQGVLKEERNKKATESMMMVGLDGYGNQMVSELSGGMQQRVGLARALANNPEVLLMDEAFSALDPLIRNEMQDELITLQKKLKKTIVFITHDLDEAIKLGDRIAIMKDGAIVQVGTPEEILTQPADDYVRDFVENVNRSKIVTAASIMNRNPVMARFPSDGPSVADRKMRTNDLVSLPVVNREEELMGRITLREVTQIRRANLKSIEPIIKADYFAVSPETILEDIVPLMTKTNLPIFVTDEEQKLLGLIPLNRLVIEMTGKEEREIDEIIQQNIEA